MYVLPCHLRILLMLAIRRALITINENEANKMFGLDT